MSKYFMSDFTLLTIVLLQLFAFCASAEEPVRRAKAHVSTDQLSPMVADLGAFVRTERIQKKQTEIEVDGPTYDHVVRRAARNNSALFEQGDLGSNGKLVLTSMIVEWAAREWADPVPTADSSPSHSSSSAALHECSGFHRAHGIAESWFSFQSGAVPMAKVNGEYALSKPLFDQIWSAGSASNMKPISNKLQLNRLVRILVLGGSFTRGHGCAESPGDKDLGCAWPSRLQLYLHQAFPDKAIEVVNRAEHGFSTPITLQTIGALTAGMLEADSVPDMVIMDSLVNDIPSPLDAVVGAEKLIRALQELLPKAQLVLVTDGCPNCIADASILRTRTQVAQHYGIPTLDYAALVMSYNKGPNGQDRFWPFSSPALRRPLLGGEFTVENSTWDNFEPVVKVYASTCCPGNHPPWPVHKYISDALGYGFLQILSQACQDEDGGTVTSPTTIVPFHSTELLERYESCLRPLSFHTAKGTFAPLRGNAGNPSDGPIVQRGDWDLLEDMRGRPGWISTQAGATISFPVRFGRQPFLSVSYLRSYEHIGNATMSIVDANGNVELKASLDGHWGQRYSLPRVVNFNAMQGCIDCHATGVIIPGASSQSPETIRKKMESFRHGYYNVVFEVDDGIPVGSKVKLLSVSTC